MTGPDPHVLREYALIADGERGALLGPRGDLAWLCAPRWDSDAVFTALVGGDSVYAVTPRGRFVWGGYYEPSSLIWRSRWVTGDGIVECREALAFPGAADRVVVLRRVMAVDGPATLDLVLRPAAGFGAHRPTDARRDDAGRWTARLGPLWLRWSGAPDAHLDADGWRADLTLRSGQHHDLVLELDTRRPGEPPNPGRCWTATETGWRETVPDLRDTVAPRDAAHAYATLRGLTSAGGGMVAAATMGLPERAEQGRNYDYRYVWIRDQCLAGQAVAADGPHPLLDDAVRFVTGRLLADGPKLAPAYTVAGEPVPDQRSVRLPGYPGGADIAGNHVNAQFQLDVFGEALLLFAAAARHDRLDADAARAAGLAIEAIEGRWHEPDAGIWELADNRWAHSRLTCAAGLRAVAALAPGRDAGRWLGLADHILADAAGDCVHPSGRWRRAPDDDRVDAALLLPLLRGATPATDPRAAATLDGVLAELADDGYCYRFRQDARPAAHAEGAFLLCGFVLAMALHEHGRPVAAGRWFERNRAACGPPGLYAEEYDIGQRQLRGNLPQAFVHAALLESAIRLAGPPAPGHR